MANSEISGYSTQAKISLRIAELVHQGRIDLWCSREFNPIHNTPSSSPLRIYYRLDCASKRHAPNRKTTSVERNLVRWVRETENRGEIDRATMIQALQAIKSALESGEYSPVVLYLKDIEYPEPMGEPDEFLARGQSLHETRNVWQILPPVG